MGELVVQGVTDRAHDLEGLDFVGALDRAGLHHGRHAVGPLDPGGLECPDEVDVDEVDTQRSVAHARGVEIGDQGACELVDLGGRCGPRGALDPGV